MKQRMKGDLLHAIIWNSILIMALAFLLGIWAEGKYKFQGEHTERTLLFSVWENWKYKTVMTTKDYEEHFGEKFFGTIIGLSLLPQSTNLVVRIITYEGKIKDISSSWLYPLILYEG